MDSKDLFHASRHRYAPGERLVSAVRDELSVDRQESEDRLAKVAPSGMQSRLSARYASDSANFAALYWSSEARPGDERHLYRVRAATASRHPMALVDVAARERDEATFAAIAGEYWQPTRTWRCWEYLCSEIEILEKLPWPDAGLLAGASFAFGEDRAEAKRLRP